MEKAVVQVGANGVHPPNVVEPAVEVSATRRENVLCSTTTADRCAREETPSTSLAIRR